ncbi:enoyl-CoA hydratase/isomerase family protein [Achromobacter ruhlandii]|uniref:enoyl-CoA hydratase/isomerase family protein n=1 Tax=Achromobacter ruhlandii TaxID=72557 RepID=UPI0007BF4476|nr:enoyl-CoA hydratase/isomerase family protein [Achromobacter ruhlandii]MCV6796205.1 enoyl-CoA hydratase/isomerase family protein [Achromobacter ruhlandii]MCV6804910.1 enoyl-CoA hydratase/isomerase family protein [Achromobacter ruhlandii]MCV6812842.1 enoyl-CoA hydratase/isomerase family protein [Achromobacter ruhlandii]MCV6820171.1 enoyl-CoA hydratase/isomerase family protein [Achromobacter ruhlandii]MEB6663971.1 enoyl-CoA hydratase/isomerase family protein [Achromobacter ruhlandii]
MSTPTPLLVDRDGPVARLTLNRPDMRNAFDETLIAALTTAVREAADDPAVRVLLLTGAGKAFCAGGDLNWMRRMATLTDADNRADADRLARMLRAIWSCPKPVVAAVNGDAYAGGMGLVAACDVAIAADHAQFCLSETRLGLLPATISPYVIRAMGERAANRYFLTAERFDAAAAYRMGLLHGVVPLARLQDEADAVCRALCDNGPQAVQASKRLVRDFAGRPLDDALVADSVERIAAVRASDEAREGVSAFLEKRPPAWRAS